MFKPLINEIKFKYFKYFMLLYYMSLVQKIYEISKIQQKWKSVLELRKNINKELFHLRNILESIVNNIDKYRDIITKKNYNKSLRLITYSLDLINRYPVNLNIKTIFNSSKFKLYSNMAKIKLSLTEITRLTGLIDIHQSIFLFLDNASLPKDYNDFINYYTKFFKITSIESYLSKNNQNISFVLNTFGKDIKKTSITLTSYQLNKFTINKYNCSIKNINIQVMGAKIYIPFENKLMVLFGYFTNDDLNRFSSHHLFSHKYIELENLFNNLDINVKFKENYLKSLSICEFSINSPSQICNNCISIYNDHVKMKNWNISKIVKSFILSNDIGRYKIIKTFVMDTSDSNSGYIANLLVDLMDNQSNIIKINNIINVFHWNIKRLLKDTRSKIIKETENVSTEIPYEKKIHLMKTTERVKAKARDKLKEITSGKPGESNNKAVQYLDGLLKIPFGNYKRSVIKKKLDELLLSLVQYKNLIKEELDLLEENNILNDTDLMLTEELHGIIKSNDIISKTINIKKFIDELNIWYNRCYDNVVLKKYYKEIDLCKFLKKNYKVKDLEEFPMSLSPTKSKNKSVLINKIIHHVVPKNNIDIIIKKIKIKKKFNILPITHECHKIFNYINQIVKDYQNYIVSQSNYFKDIDDILNSSIYGLETSKLQIKRMLGQWISGKNDGYIFGFEGPPGTGKTTLAKKGISKCLKDEFGVDRPFIFIPLGGSSNGSTLEGHNYTYVGSTWGRIVDGLMDSKCMNPIIYIDELDKISKTEHGKELIGILTHLTDKSQNNAFMDKYFSGIPIDLSKCLIIFSYNDANLIDRILLDRIHRIEIKPLNKSSKIVVANKHLIPEILDNIGYTDQEITINDTEIGYIIDKYTYEAGARKLKEKLYELYRDINLNSLIGGNIIPFTITREYIDETFIDYNKNEILKIHDKPRIGTINGLFATSAGVGGITIIETKKFVSNTHLELKLTGMQGDVMKESMEVSKTLALSIIPKKIRDKLLNPTDKFGIHIHCPAGATKKDGPSAGTAITMAIISLLCEIPISHTIGITGEINLNGEMLPIGGLYSKAEGGKLAGISKILCPVKNKKDLEKILKDNPHLENKDFKIVCKNNIYEAIEATFLFPDNKTKKLFIKS